MTPWADATLAAALFAVDPAGTGAVVRASAGPVRDAWLALWQRGLVVPPRRVPLTIRDDRLLGGLDLAATLQAGRPVAQRGLLAEADGGVLLVPMAERLSADLAARLTAVMDQREVRVERDGIAARLPARWGLLLLDEGIAADEVAPAALRDRLAFAIELDGLNVREAVDADFGDLSTARALLPQVRCDDALLKALCEAAAALGVDSLRAPLLAVNVARAHAALCGRDDVEAADAGVAARLVLAPRATRLPPQPADDEEPPPPEPPPPEPQADDTPPAEPPPDEQVPTDAPLDDVVLAAALAALPPDLLARLRAGLAPRGAGSAGKTGALQKSGARGRPAGVRRGEPRGGQRLNLIETLRAAAPWQRLRGAVAPRIQVRAEDFVVTRHQQRRETTAIFVVDASGSAALNRLAEAKGAVELLLADCYVRRDRVAVIAFRGKAAELLLPPTRSLVRAKRSLAGLPGGGGTPLAAAIDAAAALADAVRRRGATPLVVLLTDGRANVGLGGQGGRAQAEADALAAARRLRASGIAALLVDTSPQPHPQAQRVAAEMHATYVPLPYAGAQALSQVVRARAHG